MQLKHFKKTFIMNNEWSKTCKALKGLFDILVCSKCHNNLHDPHQFLRCGHFLCVPCLKISSPSCYECQLPSEKKDTMEYIQRIVEACRIIANEIGYKQNIENLETKSQTPPIYKTENNTNETNNPIPKLQKVKKNKRKGGAYLINDHSKKIKWDKPSPAFRIPKNIDKRNHHGETKLHTECKKGNSTNVEDLLKAGADPNVTCNAGWTALQESSDYHLYNIVEILLQYKADINKCGHEGRTALHEAVKNKDKEMVKLLLRHGANTNIKDHRNNKPIHYCNSEEIKVLLDPNNENTDFINTIPELKTDNSINEYRKPGEKSTVSRRSKRHSICQNTDVKDSKIKTTKNYFSNTHQPSTSKETDYDDLPVHSKITLENESRDSSKIRFSEDSKKRTPKKKTDTPKNEQNVSCKSILTDTLTNQNSLKSLQRSIQPTTSKIACSSSGQSNHKNDAKSRTTSKLNSKNLNDVSICSNNKMAFKSHMNLENNDSEDSDVELIFETMKGPVQGTSKVIKEEEKETFKNDYINSQESIDVVNYSSCIDTEDMIIDIEN